MSTPDEVAADLCPANARSRAVDYAWRGRCQNSFFLVLLALAVGSLRSLPAAEPLAVTGRIGPSAGSTTLLLDPVNNSPAALLTDPFGRLSGEARGVVLQTSAESAVVAGLLLLTVNDSLPEYWAQPAVWQPFLKGPAAFSGFGRELRARDWAGRQATDHRAYALDPGLRSSSTPATVAPPGAGSLAPGLSLTGFSLSWRGIAGRVYRVQRTPSLSEPFQDVQTIIPSEDGPLSMVLPQEQDKGFYRVSESQLYEN